MLTTHGRYEFSPIDEPLGPGCPAHTAEGDLDLFIATSVPYKR